MKYLGRKKKKINQKKHRGGAAGGGGGWRLYSLLKARSDPP